LAVVVARRLSHAVQPPLLLAVVAAQEAVVQEQIPHQRVKQVPLLPVVLLQRIRMRHAFPLLAHTSWVVMVVVFQQHETAVVVAVAATTAVAADAGVARVRRK
jgi:hypothetical protein